MHFEIYNDKKLEWRWRLVASNGKIIADSGEGYTRKATCRNAIKRLNDIIRWGNIIPVVYK